MADYMKKMTDSIVPKKDEDGKYATDDEMIEAMVEEEKTRKQQLPRYFVYNHLDIVVTVQENMITDVGGATLTK